MLNSQLVNGIRLIGFCGLAALPAVAGDIVIHEIHYAPGDKTVREEFVELFNRGTTAVDLGGWTLAEAVSFTFPPGVMLEPREYLVLARDLEGAGVFYNVDIFGQYEGKLDNAGDTIELRDAGDVLIDFVAYDDLAPWPAEADGGGPSLELIDSGSDNSDPASWALGLPYSPGALNDPVEAGGGDVVITEIMYKPVIELPREKAHPVGETELLQGDDPGGEYAEIFNRSGQTIDLTGWKFTDGIAFEFPAGTSIAPGAFLLIAADPAGIQRRHQQGDNVLGPYTGRLNNGGERVTLRDQDGQLVESIVFGDRYPWPVAPDEFGFSLERIDPMQGS